MDLQNQILIIKDKYKLLINEGRKEIINRMGGIKRPERTVLNHIKNKKNTR